MNALATMLAVAVALMLAGCGGGGSSPLAGMPGGGPELVASGGGTGPVARVGEGDGTSPTAPGDGSEGGGTGPVARVGEGGGTGDDGISWDQFLERLEWMSDGIRHSHPTRQTVQDLLEAEEGDYEDEQDILYGNTHVWNYHNRPSPQISGISCKGGSQACAVMKSRITAARELPGQRFQGTLQSFVEDDPGSSLQFYGGWLDNSVFYAGTASLLLDETFSLGVSGDVLVAQSIGRPLTPSSIEDQGIRDEFVGVYRGEAVDMQGNWGTSEVNLAFKLNVPTPQHPDQESGTATVVDLTIDIPAYGKRSWRDEGSLGWAFSEFTHMVPPEWAIGVGNGGSHMDGKFYDGKEVGGVFQFLHAGDLVKGAFGAKKVP